MWGLFDIMSLLIYLCKPWEFMIILHIFQQKEQIQVCSEDLYDMLRNIYDVEGGLRCQSLTAVAKS